MRAVRIHSRHFNGRQPSGLGKNNLTAGRVFFWGVEWEAYARDKIPLQEFALKMPGGLMREGGVYLRDTTVFTKQCQHIFKTPKSYQITYCDHTAKKKSLMRHYNHTIPPT